MATGEATELIRFLCPHCGKRNKAPAKAAGFGGTCVARGGGVEVPDLNAARQRRIAQRALRSSSVQRSDEYAYADPAPSAAPSTDSYSLPAALAPPEADYRATVGTKVESLEDLADLSAMPQRAVATPKLIVAAPYPWWAIAVAHALVPIVAIAVFIYLPARVHAGARAAAAG